MFLFLLIALIVSALLLRPPNALLDLLDRLHGGALFRVETDVRQIALTIDDAPDPTLTPAILELLERHDVRATFFVIGEYAQAHPALLDSIRAAGHELANHAFTDRRSVSLSDEEFETELLRTDSLLFQSDAPKTKWCRPGHGALSRRLVRIMRPHDYAPALATAYPLDLRLPAALTTFHMGINLRPGAIFVLHDGSPDRQRTLDVLEAFLPDARERGFELVTLSELWESRRRAG